MKSTLTLQSAKQSAALTIGAVFASLVNQALTQLRLDESLVVMAIRRSNNDLKYASLEDIGNHISQMNVEALRGFGNNVKGIYHELLFIADENSDGDDITAQIFEMTNYPGADVRLFQGGEFLTDVQLKAVNSQAIIDRHFERYPDISVMATDEIASTRDDVLSSGFSNADLQNTVDTTAEELASLNPVEQAADIVLPVGLASAALQARQVLKGHKSVNEASGQALQDMGIAVTSSFLVSLIFVS